MISKQILADNIFKQARAHFFCTQLNSFTYFQTIQFIIRTVLFQAIQFSMLTKVLSITMHH